MNVLHTNCIAVILLVYDGKWQCFCLHLYIADINDGCCSYRISFRRRCLRLRIMRNEVDAFV